MKKGVKLLLCVMISAIFFLSGLFIGRKSSTNYVPLLSNTTVDAEQISEPIDFRLDINTATKMQLMELHGIGELLAERIIAYREQYGPYATTDELLNVDGIGQKTLLTINEWIKVGG